MSILEWHALGLGPKRSLFDACEAFGFLITPHVASEDARGAAQLMIHYRRIMDEKCIRNFSDLFEIAKAKYMESWTSLPLQPQAFCHLPAPRAAVSRARSSDVRPVCFGPDYTTALMEAISDLEINEEEIRRLDQIKARQGLREEQVRAIHAGVFTWMISRSAADGWVDEVERRNLQKVLRCLSQLGWAPGE